MIKKCNVCGVENRAELNNCVKCGADLTSVAPTAYSQFQQPASSSQPVPPPPPVAPFRPPVYPIQPAKPPMNIFDILGIIGFVASICGIFWCAIILLPLAVVFGFAAFFKANRIRGLAIAAIVIACVASIGQIIYILYQNNLIPDWVYSGLFS